MMKSEKEMIYFEEVDRIKVFRGVNKQLVLGRELLQKKTYKRYMIH